MIEEQKLHERIENLLKGELTPEEDQKLNAEIQASPKLQVLAEKYCLALLALQLHSENLMQAQINAWKNIPKPSPVSFKITSWILVWSFTLLWSGVPSTPPPKPRQPSQPPNLERAALPATSDALASAENKNSMQPETRSLKKRKRLKPPTQQITPPKTGGGASGMYTLTVTGEGDFKELLKLEDSMVEKGILVNKKARKLTKGVIEIEISMSKNEFGLIPISQQIELDGSNLVFSLKS